MTGSTNRPSALARTLCTLSALFLGGLGMLAIVTETHSGYARLKGYVTLLGDQAVSMGFVILCMALLPWWSGSRGAGSGGRWWAGGCC